MSDRHYRLFFWRDYDSSGTYRGYNWAVDERNAYYNNSDTYDDGGTAVALIGIILTVILLLIMGYLLVVAFHLLFLLINIPTLFYTFGGNLLIEKWLGIKHNAYTVFLVVLPICWYLTRNFLLSGSIFAIFLPKGKLKWLH